MIKKIQCPYCFERFAITVFVEDGVEQSFVYDCEICCHPLEVQIHFDESTQKVRAEVSKTTGD